MHLICTLLLDRVVWLRVPCDELVTKVYLTGYR